MAQCTATAVLPNLPTSFPEKLRGMVGTVGGGNDTEQEEQVHAACWAHPTKAASHTVIGVVPPGESAGDREPLEDRAVSEARDACLASGEVSIRMDMSDWMAGLPENSLLIVAGTSRTARRPSPGGP